MKKVGGLLLVSLLLLPLTAGGNKAKDSARGADGVITISYLIGESAGKVYELQRIEEFNAMQEKIVVKSVLGPASASDLYTLILQTFEAQKDTVDVLPVDTIWPGDFAEHLVDLNPFGGQDIAQQMFPGLVANNTLDGKLLALPAFNTAGLMLYRTDLLTKYGFDQPPKTWDELETMAATIQEGERQSNPDFWGYVWQGASYEGLVCNVLEWTYSNGDDVWINANRRITINNPKTMAAIQRAKSWIGSITPPGVLAFKEEDSRALFQAGNVAFHRNWFYAYGLANAEDSPLRGRVEFTTLPAGDSGHGAATTGAWSRGISRYSRNPQAAYQFLTYLVSKDVTVNKAMSTSEFPPYPELYQDQETLKKLPVLESLEPVFINSVARPSTITAPNYNAVSTAVARGTHDMLSGRMDVEAGLEELAEEIADITGFEIS